MACNSSLEWWRRDPQSKLAIETSHISKLQGCLGDPVLMKSMDEQSSSDLNITLGHPYIDMHTTDTRKWKKKKREPLTHEDITPRKLNGLQRSFSSRVSLVLAWPS